MPRTRATRTIAAEQAEVWAVVSDPHHLPRWWPRVERVEGVDGEGFTEVLRSSRGRPVRADFHVAEVEDGVRLRWEQQLAGTPFERVLRSSAVIVALEPARAGGTIVTLELQQALAGLSRFSAPLVRRAARELLNEAHELLERLLVEPTPRLGGY